MPKKIFKKFPTKEASFNVLVALAATAFTISVSEAENDVFYVGVLLLVFTLGLNIFYFRFFYNKKSVKLKFVTVLVFYLFSVGACTLVRDYKISKNLTDNIDIEMRNEGPPNNIKPIISIKNNGSAAIGSHSFGYYFYTYSGEKNEGKFKNPDGWGLSSGNSKRSLSFSKSFNSKKIVFLSIVEPTTDDTEIGEGGEIQTFISYSSNEFNPPPEHFDLTIIFSFKPKSGFSTLNKYRRFVSRFDGKAWIWEPDPINQEEIERVLSMMNEQQNKEKNENIKRRKATDLLQGARDYYVTGKDDKARKDYNEALNYFKKVGDRNNEGEAMSGLGDLDESEGRDDDAQKDWEEAIILMNGSQLHTILFATGMCRSLQLLVFFTVPPNSA